MTKIEITRTSALAAPAAEVWAAVTTMAGVNAELLPWVRMTHPRDIADLRSDPERLLGRVAFHSWLLAGGRLPFDRHSLRLVSVEEHGPAGGAFVEESTSWLQRRWRHQRDVTATSVVACTVTDRLVVEPRVSLAAPIVSRIVGRLFDHRHRRLRAMYGPLNGTYGHEPS